MGLNFIFDERDKIIFQADVNSAPTVGNVSCNECQFYSINPVARPTRRAALNVSAFKNFLFESDTLSLEQQEKLYRQLSTMFPIAQITFSGSKSFHLIVSVADELPFKVGTDEGVASYKQLWAAIESRLTVMASAILGPECPSKLFDPATKDAARLSRTPGAHRDNGVLQSELIIEPRLATSEFLLGLLSEHKPFMATKPPVPQVPSMTVDALKFELKQTHNEPLWGAMTSYTRWCSSTNMYPVLFKYTLWLIDATGAPLDTALAYYSERIFPYIRECGYPRNPELGVYAAYTWKGLR